MAAAPDFVLAAAFLLTWVAPTTLGQQAVRRLMNVIELEFIVVHATGALGAIAVSGMTRSMKVTMFSGLAVVYFFFVGAISKMSGSVWPLVSFYGLMFAKLPAVVFGMRQAEGKKGALLWWPVMAVAYVMGAFVTAFLPLPRLGITAQVIAAQGFVNEGGIWVDEPQRVMAFGFLYFVVLGFYALTSSLQEATAAADGAEEAP
ncbi:MAG: hypothetical protein AMK73_09320 [Planctomycetes bacterium SM23_32]|nr:MAG: hypothetical protein AMK73_09320 [Planctomycetes bacterium SM23_32]